MPVQFDWTRQRYTLQIKSLVQGLNLTRYVYFRDILPIKKSSHSKCWSDRFFFPCIVFGKTWKIPFSLKWTRLISDPHLSRYYEPPREVGVHILWTPKWVQWSIPLTPKNYPPKPKFQERIISFKPNLIFWGFWKLQHAKPSFTTQVPKQESQLKLPWAKSTWWSSFNMIPLEIPTPLSSHDTPWNINMEPQKWRWMEDNCPFQLGDV